MPITVPQKREKNRNDGGEEARISNKGAGYTPPIEILPGPVTEDIKVDCFC